jgi:hypothetical protein
MPEFGERWRKKNLTLKFGALQVFIASNHFLAVD